MGASATRITRQDLVTPAEFRGLDATGDPAGRVGGTRIELVKVGGETRLGACYQQIPVRVMPPFSLDNEPAALLYLINLTAGLMDGDGHRIDVTARSGTRAVVTGQSASRVHPAVNGYASQQWSVTVEDDACLVVLPGPTIPFRGSRYYQRGRVRLAPTASLIWGDIWLPGRHERGVLSEQFQFDRIVQDCEVHRAGRLIYRDRFCWNGPWTAEEAGWYWGGSMACGSLFVAGPVPEVFPEPASNLRRSVFPLDTGACCVRWCGEPTAVAADLVRVALQLGSHAVAGPGARPWLLDSTDLAPNHWFSAPVASRDTA